MAKQDHSKEKDSLQIEHPISEKDEVKGAEDRTAKQQKEAENDKAAELKKKLDK